MQHNQRDGAILILLSVAGYSCLPIITKYLFALGADSISIAFWRYLFALIVFGGIIFVRSRRGEPVQALPRVRLLLLGTLFAGESLAAFFALEFLPAGTFSVLFYCYPAIVAIIQAFLGERLSRLAWFALVMTLIGLVLTAPDFSAGFGGGNLIGLLMALFDALMVAIYFVISSRVMHGHADMVRTSAWTVTGAFIVIVLFALARGLAVPQGIAWGYILFIALISTVLPIFALNAGIQKLGATRAAIIATFEPVFTAGLALVFLGEIFLPVQILGGVLIIVSVILLQLRRPAVETASIV